MTTAQKKELMHAELAIGVAIVLQSLIASELSIGPKWTIVVLELVLAAGIGITAFWQKDINKVFRRWLAITLIALVTLVNISSLILVSSDLINGTNLGGKTLIFTALAIFLTNIIMFGLWYWEIDSPGLTGHHLQGSEQHFLFPQMDRKETAKSWQPTFFDYLYVSVTNATAFSPTDTLPLTHTIKALMSLQAIVSLLTIALVAARAVNILG